MSRHTSLPVGNRNPPVQQDVLRLPAFRVLIGVTGRVEADILEAGLLYSQL